MSEETKTTTAYPDADSRSASLYERALDVIPGGNSYLTVHQSPYVIYAARGDGFTVTDVDGVERLDFVNNHTTLVHGHCHPAILDAVRRQISVLGCVSLGTEAEIALAETLCERISSIEKVRFTNSGTEAVMQAIRAARAATGRFKIAKCEGSFHGSYDFAEVSISSRPDNWGNSDPVSVPYVRGTPTAVLENVIVIKHNDVSAIEDQLEPHAEQLAAVLIDPLPAANALVPATPEFLAALRTFTDRHGIVLISDEVICSRLAVGGAQEHFGFTADLTALGKTIGGGLPIGAVGGRADIMEVFDVSKGKPALPHGGTFNANPLSMTAGKAAMDLLDHEEIARLNDLGKWARQAFEEVIEQSDRPVQTTGCGSMFMINLHDRPVWDHRSSFHSEDEDARQAEMFHYFLNNGVLMTAQGMGSLSTPMGMEQIERVAETLRQFLLKTNWTSDSGTDTCRSSQI